MPVILNCDNDGDHASEIIPAHKSHYKMIPNNDKDALYDAIKSFDVDRKEVQEMTWEKHNKKKLPKNSHFISLRKLRKTLLVNVRIRNWWNLSQNCSLKFEVMWMY